MEDELAGLYRSIDGAYNLAELRTLCFELGVDYDSLPGEAKAGKIRELLLLLKRKGELERLQEALRRPRPAVETGAQGYTPPLLPDLQDLPDPGPLPPGSRLPFALNQIFTGRVEPLQQLARTLLHGDGPAAPITQAVAGMGGIGKTQLAVEFAYRYGRFFHGVHWINAREPAAISAEVAACGAEMLLPNWPEELPEQVTRTLDAWCQGPAPRLVVLDNLEEVEAAREWLGRLRGGPVRVLLAARRGEWPRDAGLESLALDVFNAEESRAFLRTYLAEERAPDDALDALAERLGHLPLALELAGRYLAGRRLPVTGYMDRLEQALADPAMLDWKPEWGQPTAHDLALRAAFALSWEQVTGSGADSGQSARARPISLLRRFWQQRQPRDSKQADAARRVFLAVGHCAPDHPVPRELLQEALRLDASRLDDALAMLAGLGLLAWDAERTGPIIHPLLAGYARVQEGAAGVLPGLADALAHLAWAANDELERKGDRAQWEPLWAHVWAVAGRVGREEPEDDGALWHSLGYHLFLLADYAQAKPYLERAQAIQETALGPGHPATAASLNDLGGLLYRMGDLAGARPYLERALAIRETMLGSGHPDTGRSLNNLGALLYEMGDLAEARPYYERALAIQETHLGPGHLNTAHSLNNLGSLLQDMGDLAGARPCFERALAIFKNRLPPDHPHIRGVASNLAALQQRLGDGSPGDREP